MYVVDWTANQWKAKDQTEGNMKVERKISIYSLTTLFVAAENI